MLAYQRPSAWEDALETSTHQRPLVTSAQRHVGDANSTKAVGDIGLGEHYGNVNSPEVISDISLAGHHGDVDSPETIGDIGSESHSGDVSMDKVIEIWISSSWVQQTPRRTLQYSTSSHDHL